MIYFMTSMQELFAQESKKFITWSHDDIFRYYDQQFHGVSSCFDMLYKSNLIEKSFENFVEERLDTYSENAFPENALPIINEALDIIFEEIYKKMPLIFSDRSTTFEQITDPVFQAIILHRDDPFMKFDIKEHFDTSVEPSNLTNIQRNVKYAHMKDVKMLTAMGVNIHVKDINGNSLLHYAVQAQILALQNKLNNKNKELIYLRNISDLNEITIFLLDAGVDVNEYNNDQKTPLHLVALNGTGSMAKILLDHGGADLNLQDVDGNSALQIASLYNNVDVIDALINAGAELKKKNKRKKIALVN